MASAPAIKVETYHPFPKQQEFHASPAKYRLFGGAAGPGKSRSLLEECCLQALEVPRADTLLLRRTYAELEKSILNTFWREIYPKWRGIPGFSYNDSKHVVRWPNGSTTSFGYCQRENDVYQYQGGEFLFIGIDELTLFTLRQWQFLTSRNRCSVPGSFPCMAGATNPGNVGHVWVKSLWVEHQPAPGMENPEEYDPAEYDFIRAKVSDNPIYANDEAYLKTLRSLPTALRKAFLDGDWDIFAGQYFDIWNEETMKVSGRHLDLKPWWPRWISIDWGFVHPAAVYWHAKDGDTVITYRELCKPSIGEQELGLRIAELSGEEKIRHVFLSPDAFAKRGNQNTIAQQIGDALALKGLPRPTLADNDRVGGARLCYEMLQAGLAYISDSCPALIKCIPTLIRDEDNLEDILKVDGDDPYDSWRYGLKTMLGAKPVPVTEQLKERMAEAKEEGIDATNRAIIARKFLQQHALNKFKPRNGGGRVGWRNRH